MDKNKILIVEESYAIQLLTKKILEFNNWDITLAESAELALKTLEEQHFDIILMDINLPGINGMECMLLIRKLSDKIKANIPIIAVTGNSMDLTLEEYIERGFTYFLQKPAKFEVLLERIGIILNK